MKSELELQRHNKIINKIETAKNIKELPNISFMDILDYLVDECSYNSLKINKKEFVPVLKAMIADGMAVTLNIKNIFIEVLQKNFPGISELTCRKKFNNIISSKRISNIFIEINAKHKKIESLYENFKLMKNKNNDYNTEYVRNDISYLNEQIESTKKQIDDLTENLENLTEIIKKLEREYLNNDKNNIKFLLSKIEKK